MTTPDTRPGEPEWREAKERLEAWLADKPKRDFKDLRLALAHVEEQERRIGELEATSANVVDCWGVGRLNITAMTEFVLELRLALEGKTDAE